MSGYFTSVLICAHGDGMKFVYLKGMEVARGKEKLEYLPGVSEADKSLTESIIGAMVSTVDCEVCKKNNYLNYDI